MLSSILALKLSCMLASVVEPSHFASPSRNKPASPLPQFDCCAKKESEMSSNRFTIEAMMPEGVSRDHLNWIEPCREGDVLHCFFDLVATNKLDLDFFKTMTDNDVDVFFKQLISSGAGISRLFLDKSLSGAAINHDRLLNFLTNLLYREEGLSKSISFKNELYDFCYFLKNENQLDRFLSSSVVKLLQAQGIIYVDKHTRDLFLTNMDPSKIHFSKTNLIRLCMQEQKIQAERDASVSWHSWERLEIAEKTSSEICQPIIAENRIEAQLFETNLLRVALGSMLIFLALCAWVVKQNQRSEKNDLGKQLTGQVPPSRKKITPPKKTWPPKIPVNKGQEVQKSNASATGYSKNVNKNVPKEKEISRKREEIERNLKHQVAEEQIREQEREDVLALQDAIAQSMLDKQEDEVRRQENAALVIQIAYRHFLERQDQNTLEISEAFSMTPPRVSSQRSRDFESIVEATLLKIVSDSPDIYLRSPGPSLEEPV